MTTPPSPEPPEAAATARSQDLESTSSLTHLTPAGEAQMVDVTSKQPTWREAEAQGQICMSPAAFAAIEAGNAPKGDVLGTARLAGIMAAKQTAQLIPLCHPLPLTGIDVNLHPNPALPGYVIQATVRTKAETGVEMEALTAVSVTALTLYDMAKALDKAMVITGIQLCRKQGGKSGTWSSAPPSRTNYP